MVRPQIIATDLDGTALCDNVRMSDRTYRAFERAQRAGIQVVIVTGRNVRYLREMELPDYHYAICCNGAVVMDMYENKAIYRDLFTPEEALTAWNIIRRYRPFVEVSVENDVVIGRENFEHYKDFHLLPFMDKYIGEGKMHVVEDLDAFVRENAGGIEKFTICRVGEAMSAAIRGELNATGLFETDPAELKDAMCIPRRLNKGNALLGLAEYLGVPREAVYAFGDGGNDLQMIKAAGCGVAMGNSPEFIKRQADCVCGPCTQDGIAEFLESNFGI